MSALEAELKEAFERIEKLEGKPLQDAYNEFKKKFPKVFKQDDNKVHTVPLEGRVKDWGANMSDPSK